MSDETKPYDPWEATDDDTRHAIRAFSAARSSGGDIANGMLAAMRVYGDRVRARVEANQASPKPATHHDKPWVKIGDRLVKAESIHEVWLNGGTWLMRQSGMCSTPLTGPEADALWAHFADPARCVDLTPGQPT